MCGGGSKNMTMLSGVSSLATAVAVSGGFSDSVSGRGDGQVDGSSRQENSLQARGAAKSAQLVGGNPASTKQNSNNQSDVGVDKGSCGKVSGDGRQSGGAVGDVSWGGVWGHNNQQVDKAARSGRAATAVAGAVEMQELREQLAGVRQQLDIQSRQWYLHQSGCWCMLCVAQQEMQQLKQQIKLLTLALAYKQGVQQQQQNQRSNSKSIRVRAATGRDGRWLNLPRPRITVKMKVAAILVEKAAEAEQAARTKAQVRSWAQVTAVQVKTAGTKTPQGTASAGATADAAGAETAASAEAAATESEQEFADCQEYPEEQVQQQQ